MVSDVVDSILQVPYWYSSFCWLLFFNLGCSLASKLINKEELICPVVEKLHQSEDVWGLQRF